MSFQLDPEVGAVLSAGPAPIPVPVGDVEGRRATGNPMLDAVNNHAQPVAPDVEIVDEVVTAADGTALPARWYRLPSSDSRAAVLYLHGGGMIMGSMAAFDGPVSRYVSATGVPMLSVDYRLAPEHPHPAPVEDAFAGLRWLHDHAARLGVDPARIAVMGDSAGGGLVAAVAILARDRGGPAVARQILVYPMLDDRNTAADAFVAPFAVWTSDDNVTGWNALLGEGHEGATIEPTAAPARLQDARGLPPAYIEVGQLDIFRDEDVAYAVALGRAGIEVELHVHPGVPHEYDAIAFGSDVARRARADRHRVITGI